LALAVLLELILVEVLEYKGQVQFFLHLLQLAVVLVLDQVLVV
jgi:hypothetical protein